MDMEDPRPDRRQKIEEFKFEFDSECDELEWFLNELEGLEETRVCAGPC